MQSIKRWAFGCWKANDFLVSLAIIISVGFEISRQENENNNSNRQFWICFVRLLHVNSYLHTHFTFVFCHFIFPRMQCESCANKIFRSKYVISMDNSNVFFLIWLQGMVFVHPTFEHLRNKLPLWIDSKSVYQRNGNCGDNVCGVPYTRWMKWIELREQWDKGNESMELPFAPKLKTKIENKIREFFPVT